MSVTMCMGGRKISREEQNNYEVVIDDVTRRIIRLQKKEVAAGESGNCDDTVLHKYA